MVKWAGLLVQLLTQDELMGVRVKVDSLFSVEIKMSEVIAFKMPSSDENHHFHLMVGHLGRLLMGAHS